MGTCTNERDVIIYRDVGAKKRETKGIKKLVYFSMLSSQFAT